MKNNSKFKTQNSKLRNKVIYTLILGLLIAVFGFSGLYAEDVTSTAQAESGAKALTFEDCMKIASEKNRDYRIAKLDKTIAEARLGQAAAGFGPVMTASAAFSPLVRQAPILLEANSFFPGFPPTDMLVDIYPAYVYSARISLMQPVFTFGKNIFAFKMAEEGQKIADIRLKQAGEKLKSSVISAFYGAIIAGELAKAQEETMKAKAEHLRLTKSRYSNGQVSKFDVLQAQVQHANSIPEAKKAADTAALAMKALKDTLGLPLSDDISISGKPEFNKISGTYEEMKKNFTDKNDDREMAGAAKRISEYKRNLKAAMLLPNFAINMNYNYLSTEKDLNFDKQYWSSSWDISLGMNWTFFDGFKNIAALNEAAAESGKAELEEEKAGSGLEIKFENLYATLEQSRGIIEAADELIKQAEEGARIAKESYKSGLIQQLDLLNAETGLLQARVNYLNAMLNYLTTAQELKNFIE